VTAIEKGFMQREIVESAYRYQKEVEAKKRVIVGVNDFITEEKIPLTILKVDPKIEKTLIERLNQIKHRRNKTKVENVLDSLRKAAEKENANLVPFILQAVKEYVTLGEICDTLREVFGEYKPPSIF
jgi:methylmalonyl-CoA mutase N-terminal domain/subunit